MYTHYLITRFNVKVTHFGPESMDSPPMDPSWLSKRLNLFIKYCAPSVLAQTNKNFKWLIYFDPDTSTSVLDKINFLKKSEIDTEFIFTANFAAMLEDLVQKIKKASTPFVINTRLDNDDVISNVFINDIQNAAHPQHNLIINFTRGFEYNILNRILTKWNERFQNQFISIIESRDASDIKSIYGFPHWRPPANATILNIYDKPYWIYLGHALNYSRLAIAGIPLFIKPEELKLFPANEGSIRISVLNTMKYAISWLPRVIRRRLKSKMQTRKN